MTQFVVVSGPNPHLPHSSVELESPPPPDARNDEIAQKNAELIISQIMTEQPRIEGPKARTAMPKPAPQSHQIEAAPAPVQTAPRPRGAEALPPLSPADADEARLRAALTADDEIIDDGAGNGLLSRLRPGYVVVALLAIVALIWPVATGAVLLLLLWLAVLLLMALNRAVSGGRWLQFARRHPRLAERLRRLADRIAEKLDVVLDYLPGRLADSLAMPDLSQPVGPQHRAGGRRH